MTPTEDGVAVTPVPGRTGADGSTLGQGGHALQAPETRRLYARDWTAFKTWCDAQEQSALPASPETAAAYLALLARRLTPGALARHATALNDRYHRASHPVPGDDPGVRAVLQAARAMHRADQDEAPGIKLPRSRAATPGPAQLARMAARCPGDLAGLRDRALLLLAAAGLDRETLLRLDREDARLTDAGVELILPNMAGEGFGDGVPTRTVALRRMAAVLACPVRALEAWLRSADLRFGPVFCKVDRWGNVEHGRLTAAVLRGIWGARCPSPPRSPPARREWIIDWPLSAA